MKRLRKFLWLFRTNILIIPSGNYPQYVNLHNIDVFYKEAPTIVTVEMNNKLRRFDFDTEKQADKIISKLIRAI